MSSMEPVNIMGVVAFPNPDKEKQVIRFIDSSYNPLFTVPDGGSIVLTYFDGRQTVAPCTYIDDCHAKIGGSVYHICEFAELMERNGATYSPEHPQRGDICDTYEIFQIKDTANTDYSFRPYGDAQGHLRRADYRRAYAGVLSPKVTMDALFAKHNRDNRPFGREMRSLSVSDVLVINRDGHKKAYYVDSFGFQEVKCFLPRARTTPKKERGEAR